MDVSYCITTFRLYEVASLHRCVLPYTYRKVIGNVVPSDKGMRNKLYSYL